MLELSITNYQMRRPPMATQVKALSDMPAKMVVHETQNDYVKKMIATAEALQQQGQVVVEKNPAAPQYDLSRNFKGSVGTLYLRENRKLHFEIDTAYTEEIVIKAFFSKKVEKRHHVACVTGIIPFTFDYLSEVRLTRNVITFTYSLTPDLQGQRVRFSFEIPDVRLFTRDLYEWAERKNFKLVKAIDDDIPKEPERPKDEYEAPPEGTLYSALVEPDNQILEFGESLKFMLKPIDSKGNPVPVSNVQWSVDPPSIGTITQDGVFSPSTDNAKGVIRVTATGGKITTNGFATINIIPRGHSRTQAYMGPQPPPPTPVPIDAVKSGGKSIAMAHQPPPPPPPPAPAPQPQEPGKTCATCNGPLSFAEQQKRWYCPKCQTWQ